MAPALTALGSSHPQLTVTCHITDQAQLRELALGTVDVVLGQRYHHLPDATPRGIDVSPLLDPTPPGIRATPVADHPIRRLLFAATRHTENENPTITTVVAALRTAARERRTVCPPPAQE
ncbi:hypothetical protein CW362_24130 [Streptomyces populi]|uniref:LysR substrate-binding domain-containing protein n=1 Tax=Streptomyces populi TaxID=2058924 RepID=A0A2I0SKL5_9ACTN|nr:hypothetical protein [Streptomyces populi]PKT70450.1 hypothetical protein CW362_24130 [Streptomyces populi]